MSRIAVFEQMAREQPEDVMVRYGLANEYLKAERWNDAVAALREVVRLNPDYTAAYQLLGMALVKTEDKDGAVKAWEQGIAAATRTGAWKARQHMEALIAGAGDESGREFCD
jgi:predicted Zn-dependent protease